MPIGNLDVRPGWILLTSGVGGPQKKWRDKLLSMAIIGFQRVKEHDGKAKYSHVEILFPVWRTSAQRRLPIL